jgi:hypothetical protein
MRPCRCTVRLSPSPVRFGFHCRLAVECCCRHCMDKRSWSKWASHRVVPSPSRFHLWYPPAKSRSRLVRRKAITENGRRPTRPVKVFHFGYGRPGMVASNSSLMGRSIDQQNLESFDRGQEEISIRSRRVLLTTILVFRRMRTDEETSRSSGTGL